jgi:hypothetical protein
MLLQRASDRAHCSRAREEIPMKTLALVFMLAAPLAFATSSFDGNWKLRPGSFHNSGKPYVFSVDQNEYRCVSCFPPMNVKPDGQFHKVKGDGYDEIAATIVDPNTLKVTERANGKVLNEATFTASQDGSELNVRFTDDSGQQPVPMEATLKRFPGTRPEPGKHPVSGTWIIATLQEPVHLPITLRMDDDSFSWSWNGQHYEAKFDGEPVAIEGDPTHIRAGVKKRSTNEVEETDTRNGTPVNRLVFALAPDGNSIDVTQTDPRSGRRSQYILDRQP